MMTSVGGGALFIGILHRTRLAGASGSVGTMFAPPVIVFLFICSERSCFISVRAAKTRTLERERAILGEDFDDVAQFFAGLLSYCSELERTDHFLVAFVTRRCHVLLQLFLDIFSSFADGMCTEPLPYYLRDLDLSNIAKIVDRHFVTDFNLAVQAGHIADYYFKTGSFPEIVILDEIIVHGRAVNNLLLEYEAAVIRRLEQLDQEIDYEKRSFLLDRLADATKLRVYAQNNEPLLLLSRYQRQFGSKRLCSPGEIKELSQKFAFLVISRGCSTSKKSLGGKHYTARNDIIGAKEMTKASGKACT